MKILRGVAKVYFRADASQRIGLGHITRSLALADMLRENHDVYFLTQSPTKEVLRQIQEVTDNIIQLSPSDDYLAEAQLIADKYLEGEEIVVLDGYTFQTEYQAIIKSKARKLICIDDLCTYHFLADAVINHAGGLKREDYSCEPYTKLYLGIEYAILRNPFIEAAKKDRKIESIDNAFVCFGGSDPMNITEKVLVACIESCMFKQIHVVVGSAYRYLSKLESTARCHRDVYIYHNLNASGLQSVMEKCHLGIVSASTIAYECIAIGMYLIVGKYIENQEAIYNGLNLENIFRVRVFSDIYSPDFLKSCIEAFKKTRWKKHKLAFRITEVMKEILV